MIGKRIVWSTITDSKYIILLCLFLLLVFVFPFGYHFFVLICLYPLKFYFIILSFFASVGFTYEVVATLRLATIGIYYSLIAFGFQIWHPHLFIFLKINYNTNNAFIRNYHMVLMSIESLFLDKIWYFWVSKTT